MQIMYVISADSTTENIALEVMFPSGSWPSDRVLDAVFLLQATTEDTDILYYLALQKGRREKYQKINGWCGLKIWILPFLELFFFNQPPTTQF